MREALNLLRLMWGRERDQAHRFIMDGFMVGHYERSYPVLHPRFEHAADMAINNATWCCEHWKQLPEQAQSLHK